MYVTFTSKHLQTAWSKCAYNENWKRGKENQLLCFIEKKIPLEIWKNKTIYYKKEL